MTGADVRSQPKIADSQRVSKGFNGFPTGFQDFQGLPTGNHKMLQEHVHEHVRGTTGNYRN